MSDEDKFLEDKPTPPPRSIAFLADQLTAPLPNIPAPSRPTVQDDEVDYLVSQLAPGTSPFAVVDMLRSRAQEPRPKPAPVASKPDCWRDSGRLPALKPESREPFGRNRWGDPIK